MFEDISKNTDKLVVGTLDQFYGILFTKSSGVFNRNIKGEAADRMAGAVSAESDTVSHVKKLFGKDNSDLKAVQANLNAARSYWISMTNPYPLRGVRLLKRGLLDEFVSGMDAIKTRLGESVTDFMEYLPAAIEVSRRRLGDLFNEADYRQIDAGCFDFSWEFYDLTLPDYLRQDNPELYAAHVERAQIRLEAAAVMTERMLLEELNKIVKSLVTGLSDNPSGKKKVLRTQSFERFVTFFDRFRKLSISNNRDLELMIEDTERLISDNYEEVAREARSDEDFRNSLREELEVILANSDKLLEDTSSVFRQEHQDIDIIEALTN